MVSSDRRIVLHGWGIAGPPFLKPHFNNANLLFVFVS